MVSAIAYTIPEDSNSIPSQYSIAPQYFSLSTTYQAFDLHGLKLFWSGNHSPA